MKDDRTSVELEDNEAETRIGKERDFYRTRDVCFLFLSLLSLAKIETL